MGILEFLTVKVLVILIAAGIVLWLIGKRVIKAWDKQVKAWKKQYPKAPKGMLRAAAAGKVAVVGWRGTPALVRGMREMWKEGVAEGHKIVDGWRPGGEAAKTQPEPEPEPDPDADGAPDVQDLPRRSRPRPEPAEPANGLRRRPALSVVKDDDDEEVPEPDWPTSRPAPQRRGTEPGSRHPGQRTRSMEDIEMSDIQTLEQLKTRILAIRARAEQEVRDAGQAVAGEQEEVDAVVRWHQQVQGDDIAFCDDHVGILAGLKPPCQNSRAAAGKRQAAAEQKLAAAIGVLELVEMHITMGRAGAAGKAYGN